MQCSQPGCFTFYKGNKISANHNSYSNRTRTTMVVSPSTKVIKFQLITTAVRDWLDPESCFTFYKGNKISANHNDVSSTSTSFTVVSPSTKVIKFQLITTRNYMKKRRVMLFHLLQR